MKQEPYNEAQGSVFVLGFEDAEIFYHTEGESIFSTMKSHKTHPSSIWDGAKWTPARTRGKDD